MKRTSMQGVETLRIALAAVRTNRLRSALTVLGILIGIASVTLTVGLGRGAQQSVEEQIASLGSNLLIISPGSSTSTSGVRGGRGTATTLTMSDAQALADGKVAPDIAHVAPVTQSQLVLTQRTTTWTTSVVGTTPEWLPVRNRTVGAGRFMTNADLSQGAAVVVLGPSTASELFGNRSAVGQTVSISGTDFTVIGVLDAVGSSSATDEDDTAIVPQTTAAARLGASSSAVSTIYVSAVSAGRLSAAYQEADAALMTQHHLTAADSADFSITTQQSLVSAATSTTKTLTILLGGIAAISLLVGGIGVMNIMLVSVSERTREIGLRKALGATPRVIRQQFLTEASTLGLAGGVLGLAVGLAGALILPKVLNQPVAVSAWASVGALVVAIGVGVVAGVYPAGRAARLAPIDALRRE